MTAYVLRRLGYALLTFVGITIATFVLIHSVPGDPVSFYIGRAGAQTVPQETLARIRAEYHLDEPLPTQYLHWLRNAATLDFGRSIVDRRPVRERILEKLPNTFQLNAIAFVLAAIAGVPLGLWSALRAGSAGEQASAIGLFVLYSLPSFWVALVLMQLFAVKWNVLPLLGMTSDDYSQLQGVARLGDRLSHLVLPVTTLMYAQLAIFARFSRSAFREVIRQDYITAARARGAAPAAVLWNHAFRNALVPLTTLLGLSIPFLISGSVIVEKIFQWDGIGLLYYESILARDYPTVMALTVATALLTLAASLLADLLYMVVDPRIRLGTAS